MKKTRKSSASPRRGSPQPRYALNVRLIAWTLGFVALFAPMAYAWHASMVDKGAVALKARAKKLKDTGDWHKAAESLHRYLRLKPDDAEVRADLAEAFGSGAVTPAEKARAIALYADAIASQPNNSELLRKQMQLLIDTGDFTLALERADELLKREPRDAAGLRGRALGLLAKWRFKSEGSPETLVDALKVAITHNADDALLASELAGVYRTEHLKGVDQQRRHELADEVMQHLIDASSKKPEALLARYTFRTKFALEGADADLDRALKTDTQRKHFDVWLAAAARAYQQRDWKAAADLFDQVIRLRQGDARGYLGLGLARDASGDASGAVKAWRMGLERADANDLPLLFRLASHQIRSGELDDARVQLDKLQKQADRLLGPQKAEWFANIYSTRADMALAGSDYRAAIDALAEVLRLRRTGLQTPEMVANTAQLEQRVGACHMALRQWDEAASAYQRAASLEPGRAAPRFAAANAWDAAGRLDEAALQYEHGLALEKAAGPMKALAQVRFRQQLLLPKDKRDWRDFSESLEKAQEQTPDDTLLKLLGAEFELEQGRPELALDVVRKVEAEALASAELTRRVVFDYERCQRPEEADRVLALLRERSESTLPVVLLAADLRAARGEVAAAAESLRQAVERLPADDRREAALRAALLQVAAGQTEAAIESLKDITAKDRRGLEAQKLLAELLLDAADNEILKARGSQQPTNEKQPGAAELTMVKACADAIKEIEGRDGSVWRFYEAQRLLRETALQGSKTASLKLLNQATALADEVERRRPNWALSYVLRARLRQSPLRPEIEDATNAYFQALRLGENRLRIYEELVLLLYQQNRLVEAAAYLERLRAAGSLSPLLNTMAIAVDARQGNLTRAIESARHDVERQPDNALAHLRLGQLLAQAQPASDTQSANNAQPEGEANASARLAEAEAELRRATQLAAGDARSWLALLNFYVQTKQTTSAEALLEEIGKNESLTGDVRPFVLAQGYSLIGANDKAADFYREAVAAAPDDLAVQLQAARFFFDTDKSQAEACLNKARELSPDDANVRRLLAALRATQSMSEEDLEGIFTLLDGAEAGNTADPADKRLKAVLLLRRGGTQSRQQAQKLLETLVSDGRDAAPIDRLLLARLYEARGKGGITAAREQLEALINREKPSPDHLAIYVDHLLRNNQAPQAAATLDQLAEGEPDTTHFRTLSLRARWLKALGRPAEIEPKIETFIKANVSNLAPAQQAAVLREVANLYSLVELQPLAEKAYRQALKADPTTYPAFAMWLVRQHRTADAIQLCQESAESDSGPRPAITLCTVLALGNPSAEERQQADSIIEKALAAHSSDVRLLFSTANARLMEGKNDEAIELLRQVLQIAPKNLQAMNNLAMLLAEQPAGQKEALTYIDRAIALKGLDPELLDTKGWILLRRKLPKEAEAVFREALAVPPGDPRHQLHLASAYQAQGKLKEARQTLDSARENKLTSATLSPGDQALLADLETSLK